MVLYWAYVGMSQSGHGRKYAVRHEGREATNWTQFKFNA